MGTLFCDSLLGVSNILDGKVANLPPILTFLRGQKKLIRRVAIDEWIKAQEAASVEAAPKC